jgi:hypothetical protein
LEFDSDKGISIGSAAGKGVDQSYANALASIEKSEQIKLRLGDNKTLIFVVVDKNSPTNDFFERETNEGRVCSKTTG